MAAAVDTTETVELVTVGNVDIVVTTTAAAAAAAAVVLEMLMSVADKRSASRRVGEDLEEKWRERGREGEGQREMKRKQYKQLIETKYLNCSISKSHCLSSSNLL